MWFTIQVSGNATCCHPAGGFFEQKCSLQADEKVQNCSPCCLEIIIKCSLGLGIFARICSLGVIEKGRKCSQRMADSCPKCSPAVCRMRRFCSAGHSARSGFCIPYGCFYLVGNVAEWCQNCLVGTAWLDD